MKLLFLYYGSLVFSLYQSWRARLHVISFLFYFYFFIAHRNTRYYVSYNYNISNSLLPEDNKSYRTKQWHMNIRSYVANEQRQTIYTQYTYKLIHTHSYIYTHYTSYTSHTYAYNSNKIICWIKTVLNKFSEIT